MALVLYSRKECSLCDAFEAELKSFLSVTGLSNTQYEKIDVDSDAGLKHKYGSDVPVLTINNQLVCQHFFDKDKITQALG